MRLAGLFSGGKDSTYAAHIAEKNGHILDNLVSLKSMNPDSYMFHTVNINITKLQAQAWGISYIEAQTLGIKEKELEDLKKTLGKLDVDGVVTGAIASKYQADRINKL
ncbi:TIGR00289 family protein, partial [Thermoproteota archaeon]